MSRRHFTTFRTETFTVIADRLNAACAWLKELGIEYPSSRIGNYQKIFNTLAGHQAAGTLSKATQEIPTEEYINAGFETGRLLYIHDGLNRASTTGVLDKLRGSLRGHHLYVLDKDDRSGRDITFELTIAAMFGQVADHIDMEQHADVVATIDRLPIYVECKRPKSQKKVETRIKEGLDQLRVRYGAADNPWMARGLLAISIDKIMNPSFNILNTDSREEISKKMLQAVEGFIKLYGPLWRQRADKRTLGVLVTLDVPAIDGSSKRVFIASQAGIDALRLASSPEFTWLEQLAEGAMPRA